MYRISEDVGSDEDNVDEELLDHSFFTTEEDTGLFFECMKDAITSGSMFKADIDEFRKKRKRICTEGLFWSL